MPIAVSCPQCNSRFAAREEMVGTKVNCPNCKGPIQINATGAAAPSAPAAASAPTTPPKAITCGDCGKQYAYNPKLAGKTVPCAACGSTISVPAAGAAASPKAPAPAAAGKNPQAIVCPDCGTKFAYRAELIGKTVPCGACGTSFTAGEEAQQDYSFAGGDDPLGGGGGLNIPLDDDPLGIPASPAGPAVPPPKKKKKRKKKKKKSALGIELPPWLSTKALMAVGGGIAALILLGVIGTVGMAVIANLPSLTSNEHEQKLVEMLGWLEDICVIVESVKDEPSARKAGDDIRKLAAKGQRLRREIEDLGAPSASEDARLKAKYDPQAKALTRRMQTAMQKIANVPGVQQHLAPALVSLGNAMQ